METRKPSVTIPVSELRRNPGPRKCNAAVPSIRPTFSVTNWGTSTTDKATSGGPQNISPCCLHSSVATTDQPTGCRRIFLFSKTPRPPQGPTWPSTEWVPEGEKLAAHLHLVPRYKNECSFTSTPPRLQGVYRVSSALLSGEKNYVPTKLNIPPLSHSLSLSYTHTHTQLQLCSSQSSTMQRTASREWAHVAAGTCINIADCTEYTVGTGSSPTQPQNRYCYINKRNNTGDSSLQGSFAG